MNQPDEKSKELPLYRVDLPDSKPRLIAARNKRGARAHAAKSFTVTLAGPREAYELGEQGIEIEVAGRKTP